jgi:plastocyanin
MNFSRFSSIAVFALAVVIAIPGCGKKDDFDDDFADDDGGGGASAQLVLDPATAATVTGKVIFDGAAPAAKVTKTDSDPVCAAAAASEKPEVTQEVVVTDGKLANVFVYVSEGVDGAIAPPEKPVEIDQQGCRYHPHVVGCIVGQKVEFKNSDPTLHNVHPTPKLNPGFNLAQATQGKVDLKSFANAEVMIPISCDVHGWMRSYLAVLPHPFFATTGTDGAFTIKDLPPGSYTLTAWHEKYGEQKQKIEVKAKETKDISFSFKPTAP